MKTQESLMTIIALTIGLSITLAIIFFNFSLTLTVKLLRTGSVPLGRYLFMISICAVNTGVVIWLAYILKKAQTDQPLVQTNQAKTRQQTPIRGPYAPQSKSSNPIQAKLQFQSEAKKEIRGPYAPQRKPQDSTTAPPLSHAKPQWEQQKEQSTQLIIALAQSQTYLSLEDVMGLTGLNDVESKYLLNELTKNKTLKIENQYNQFLYSLNTRA